MIIQFELHVSAYGFAPVLQVDASELRQIPDNQEVFLSSTGDESIITEIVEHQEVADAEIGSFYFTDLAQVNGADGPGLSALEAAEELPITAAANLLVDTRSQAAGAKLFLVRGTQRVAKFKESDAARNEIAIRMLIARLPAVGSDVLVTINAPVWISPASSSAKPIDETAPTVEAAACALAPSTGVDSPSAASGGAGAPPTVPRAAAAATPAPFRGVPLDDLAKALAASLKVNDYGLFESADDVDE